MKAVVKMAILLAGVYELMCILTVLLTSISLSTSRVQRNVIQSSFLRDPGQVTPSMTCDEVNELDVQMTAVPNGAASVTTYVEYSPDMFTDFFETNFTIFQAVFDVVTCLPSVQVQGASHPSNYGNLTRLEETGCQNVMQGGDVHFVVDNISFESMGLDFKHFTDFGTGSFGVLPCVRITHYNLGPNATTTWTCFSGTGYFHTFHLGQKYKQFVSVNAVDGTLSTHNAFNPLFLWYRLLKQKVATRGLVCRDSVVVNKEYLASVTYELDGIIIYISVASVVLFVASILIKLVLFQSGYIVVHGGAVLPAVQAPMNSLKEGGGIVGSNPFFAPEKN